MRISPPFRKKLFWLLALCIGIPGFYVLSFGPAYTLELSTRSEMYSSAVETVYAPILSYLDNNTDDYPAQIVIKYVAFCGSIFGEDETLMDCVVIE